MRCFAGLGFLLLAAGCRTKAAQPEVVQPAGTLAQIQALAAAPACTEDAQCRSLALGANPCGGPEAYLAWSSARTPAAEIEALGRKYEDERRAANAQSGRVGICRFVPDPGAVCRAGTCVLNSGEREGGAPASGAPGTTLPAS